MNKSKRGNCAIGCGTALIIILILLIISMVMSRLSVSNDNPTDSQESISEEIQENLQDNISSDIEEESIIEESTETIDMDSLSEEEYKANCPMLYHDDVFFGTADDLEGAYVKLDIFLEESYYFDSNSLNDSYTHDFYYDNNLYRDYFKCGVLRESEETESYVSGGQISVFFSQNYDFNPVNYSEGDKLIVYGQIVGCGTITTSGYNTIYFIPKYIEQK